MGNMNAAPGALEKLNGRAESREGPENSAARHHPVPHETGLASSDPPPLRSIHTSNFPEILRELGISVLVTTYQAGKLVMLRPDGDRLNTHFRGFSRPMGLAVDGDRLAVGTSLE